MARFLLTKRWFHVSCIRQAEGSSYKYSASYLQLECGRFSNKPTYKGLQAAYELLAGTDKLSIAILSCTAVHGSVATNGW